jgi:hypothetical protein
MRFHIPALTRAEIEGLRRYPHLLVPQYGRVQPNVSAVAGRENVVSSRVEAHGIWVSYERRLIVNRVGEEFQIAKSGMEARSSG